MGAIEENLRNQDDSVRECVFKKILEYELLIPRMDVEIQPEIIEEKIKGRFQSIYDWFAGSEGNESEAGQLFDATNEIIRRITRYAAQISEKNALGANRKEEYRKVAKLFMQCRDVDEAHKMSAMVFGIERPHHIAGDTERETDSMNTGVYQDRPVDIKLKPRVRMLREQKEEMEKLRLLENDGRIDFAQLPVLEPRIREILLKWISDAMEDADFSARTDDGRLFTLDVGRKNEKCVVRCEDGSFTMPKMSIVFQEEH